MRRATASGLIGLVFLLCTPRPASAQWGIIKWLEELSGPGRIVVNQLDIHFGCRWKDQPQKPTGSTDDPFKKALRTAPVLPDLACDQNPFPRKSDGTRYADAALWKSVHHYYIVGVTLPWFKGTGTNPLDYAPGTKKDHLSVYGLTGGVAYRLSSVTDLAVVGGVMHFSSSTTTGFETSIIDPHIVIRPFATLAPKWEQAVAVRLDAVWFPQGFTLDDFGATGGSPMSGKSELVTEIGIQINVGALLWFVGRPVPAGTSGR
jgi:hypothetical protein